MTDADLFAQKPVASATLSPCGRYRYALGRQWKDNVGRLGFVMLNPSTADAETDDPTIRRCIGFASLTGYGGIEVANLFAFRATNPAELLSASDPVGPDNDAAIADMAAMCEDVVVAWGTKGGLMGRDAIVIDILSRFQARILCLGTSKDGHPRHPLYLPNVTPLVPFIFKAKARKA